VYAQNMRIHTYIHIHIFIHIHIYIYINMHTYVYINMHTYTHIHTYIHTYIHIYILSRSGRAARRSSRQCSPESVRGVTHNTVWWGVIWCVA
jgi:hypothetical protein